MFAVDAAIREDRLDGFDYDSGGRKEEIASVVLAALGNSNEGRQGPGLTRAITPSGFKTE